MRIGIFTDTYKPDVNGIVTSIVQLEKELIKNGHEVFIITTSNKKVISVEGNVIRMPGIKMNKLYGYNASNFFSTFGSLKIKKLNLDIIHDHTDFGIGMFARVVSKQYSIAFVYTYHTLFEDYTYYVTKGYFDKTAKAVVARLSRILANRCSELIVPSNKTKDAMIRYGVKNKINVIPTGIDIEAIQASSSKEKVEEIKSRFGIKSSDFVVLYVGRIAREKNAHEIIDAFKILNKNHNNIKLLMVGDGPQLNEFKIDVENHDLGSVVKFAGKVCNEEIANYYKCGNIFVSTSVTETQGLTFIEAMACGLPIICREDDSLKDFIFEGENGFYINDINHLASKIKELSTYEIEKIDMLKINAVEVSKRYSSSKFYKDVIEVYNNAIKSNYNNNRKFKRLVRKTGRARMKVN